METKESVSTELDPSAVPVEDVVAALNEEAAGDDAKNETPQDLLVHNGNVNMIKS